MFGDSTADEEPLSSNIAPPQPVPRTKSTSNVSSDPNPNTHSDSTNTTHDDSHEDFVQNNNPPPLKRSSITSTRSQSKHDYSFFVKDINGNFTDALVYVDDVLITSNCSTEIQSLKHALDHKFTIKDLGLVKYFSGIELCRTNPGSPLKDPGSYKRLVGTLLYLTMTRPGISYAKTTLSQFVSSLKDAHMQAALHLLKYLKGALSKGLFYPV
ncbi:retrovirus-related pol polyprotein from transposon TNT 1-94 [Tanacetum coccineum]|uniref:Retrovirus-related pol polyprotein from transposon TNT 1-94 n=1 Tax=Tanacetum coccineum TaxID=301880 RepID=A0ABQ5EJ98_9ASTR